MLLWVWVLLYASTYGNISWRVHAELASQLNNGARARGWPRLELALGPACSQEHMPHDGGSDNVHIVAPCHCYTMLPCLLLPPYLYIWECLITIYLSSGGDSYGGGVAQHINMAVEGGRCFFSKHLPGRRQRRWRQQQHHGAQHVPWRACIRIICSQAGG